MAMKKRMSAYYVRIRPQLNGTYSVHNEDCPFIPGREERIFLGEFRSFKEAAAKAELYFPEISCCNYCSGECTQYGNMGIRNLCNSLFMSIS